MEATTTSLTHLPATATPSEVAEVLRREGGVIIDKLYSDEVIDQVLSEMKPYAEAAALGSGDDELGGGLTLRLSGLMAKSPASAEMMMNPLLTGAAQEVLEQKTKYWVGEDHVEFTSSIQLSDTTMIAIQPGESAQYLHRDDMPHHRVHPGPDSQVLALIAACDFTVENGATQVIPGSHLWDNERQPHPEEAASAVMEKGSAVFYLGSVYHGGGANVTDDEVRTAIVFVYSQAHLRQQENMYIAVPVETIQSYPVETQKMLGWGLSDPYCGLVELDDPQSYLAQLSESKDSAYEPQQVS